MRTLITAATVLISASVLAAEPRRHLDLAYTEPADASRRLDVYSPSEGKNHPVMIWIHGGGWRRGDKSSVQHKPQAFVDKGFVFVSVIPAFLILHVADRPDGTAQSQALAQALEGVGVRAKVVPGQGKTHATINTDLGLPNDTPTKAVFEFLDGLLKDC